MGTIFERDRELDAIDGTLRGARAGRGAMLLLEGPAGIGKSTLLEAAAASATERKLLVFRGAGSEHEREPLGVLLRMLRDPTGSATGAPPHPLVEPEQPADRFAIVERLFALTARLAERRPLLVTVDDVQWLDETSWALLRRLAREVEELPLSIVAALRTGERASDARGRALRALAGVETLTPGPLGRRSIAELARSSLGTKVPSALTAALAKRSGGNPLLLNAMLGALVEDGFGAGADEATIDAIVPASAKELAGSRLGRCSPAGRATALTLALLGPDLPPRAVLAEATGLAPEELARGLDELRAVDLALAGERVGIPHPVLGTAVLELAAPAELASARIAVARALAGAGLPARAAAQLTSPGAPEVIEEEWAVGCLIEAAAEAARRGATEAAISYLDRARGLPGVGDRLAEVLTQRGRILSITRDPEGVADLYSALELSSDPIERARISLLLAQACFHLVRLQEAATVAREALPELPEEQRELRLQLEAAALDADRLRGVGQERARTLESDVRAASTAGERAALAHVASEAVARGDRRADEVAALAAAAWGDGRLLEEAGAGAPVVSFVGTTLAWCERFEPALELAERQLAAGRLLHSPVTSSYALALRAGIGLRLGALAIAEADAESVVSELPASDPLAHMVCFGWLLESMLARGRLAEATELLDASGLTGEIPDLGTADFLLLARGEVRLANGDPRAALSDFEEVGRRAERSDYLNPAGFPWRSRSVIALLALGEAEAARARARAELSDAERFGAPRALAIALRALALCAPAASGERLEHQRRALSVVASSPARLVRARVQLELGSTLLERGEAEGAVPCLEAAMDEAHHCGAEPLVGAAIAALRGAGKRPRRPAIRGVDALTAQQLRVARLAAEGRSNPEIAEALFLTRRTVELHLTGAYRKLGIDSRERLAETLRAS